MVNCKEPLWILLIVTLILSMTMISVDAPQQTKLHVAPPTYTATLLGEVFTVDVNVANVTALKAFEFKLGFNNTLLHALDAVIGPFPPRPLSSWKIEIHNQDGYLLISAGSMSAADGDGTLATITFNATYAGSASCALDLYDTGLIDSSAAQIPHDVEDGNYKFAVLGVTVATDKPGYQPGENVEVHVNLTLDGSPHQGLVALEVDDQWNFGIVRRTIQIGPAPPPGNITIFDVIPCDPWGTPVDPPNFSRGTSAYFNVTVRNDGAEWKYVAVTANAYDGNMVSLGAPSHYLQIGPGFCYFIYNFDIENWACIGAGTVYVSVFTNLPRAGGVPLCLEKSANFTITDGGGEACAPETQNSGNYTLTFKLAPDSRCGIYRVYASACYLKQYVMANTVFGVYAIIVPNDYPTIQEAIDAANPPYCTILVLPETYNENVFVNKALTLFAKDQSNTIINGTGTGTVVTVTADNVEICGFTIQNSGNSFPDSGITLTNSGGSTISENTILENYNGIYLNSSSQGNTIQGNTITSNDGYGIIIDSSDNNDITDNTLSNNNYGIYLNHSTSITLQDNKMICNKYNFGVFGGSVSDFTHDIDTTNTVDGKPIYYWVNQYGGEVPADAGYVAIVSSTNIAVRGLDLTKEGQGVLLAFTNGSLIERVKIINNEYGIYQVHSYSNTIVVNSVSNNTVGIYQSYCNENLICHNNFTDNTNQVEVYQPSSNTWDDGAGKGNYWSDYAGEDLNMDGVGDTLLPHQGVDWYPLMNPYVLMHDIAVTNVTFVLPCSESQLYPGWVIDVTVTVKNEGDFTENFFNIIAYYGGNPIEIKTVPELIPQAETDINFAWDTEGVSPGFYTISAEAIAVPGETETTDNTYTDGNVTLLVPTLHDVALTNLTVILPYDLSDVYASWKIDITVFVKNEGHYREALNVTAYYGNATIEIKTITLFPLTNTTLAFTWDTTEVPTCDEYTISVNATIPVGDDPGDNMLVDGEVYVRILGDVNGDGMVVGLDQAVLGVYLWKLAGDPGFNPYADLNADEKVTGLDQAILGVYLWTIC